MKLNLKKINKSFDEKHILHDVSFNVESGRAMGFLGRNGSGKTTTIRCLMDIFKPDSGEILIDGEKFKPDNFKIGYLPEERGMYAKEKILDQLVFFCSLKGESKARSRKFATIWLERFGLLEHAKDNLETLSKGNQQKVQIIQAFLNEPDIIILDEPFSGLDPVNSQLFKDVIREEIKKDKMVIFSSHQMGYVEEFCDDITLINQGRILVNDDLQKIKLKMGEGKIRIEAAEMNRISLKEMICQIPGLSNESIDEDKISLIVTLNGMKNQEFLFKLLSENVPISLFSTYQPALTDIFVKLVKENDQDLEKSNDMDSNFPKDRNLLEEKELHNA